MHFFLLSVSSCAWPALLGRAAYQHVLQGKWCQLCFSFHCMHTGWCFNILMLGLIWVNTMRQVFQYIVTAPVFFAISYWYYVKIFLFVPLFSSCKISALCWAQGGNQCVIIQTNRQSCLYLILSWRKVSSDTFVYSHYDWSQLVTSTVLWVVNKVNKVCILID